MIRKNLDSSVNMSVVRVTETGAVRATDAVATEVPLTLEANGVEIATLLTTPSDIEDLVSGYLFTSGFISDVSEIHGLTCDTERWCASLKIARTPDPALLGRRLYTSGCGKCAMYASVNELQLRTRLQNPIVISRETVFACAGMITEGSALFQETGAVHRAVLWDPESGETIAREDVARHNAVDKAVGAALGMGKSLSRYLLVRTGRTSAEIVFKARRCGIPITISRGAPTHQAVHLAEEMGVTLIGFARGRSFNIYSCAERIEV
jgi:FdhD protein